MSRVAAIVLSFFLAAVASAATRIAPGVDLIPGEFVAGKQPDGNTVVFEGRDGLVVFDTGRHVEHVQAIIDFAAKRPVVAIVNSHWHLDHVGGNVRLREAYPQAHVYSSAAIDDALHGFLANYREQLEGAIKQAGNDAEKAAPWRAEIALIDAGSRLAPDQRIDASGARTLAGRAMHIGFEKDAVTAGDVWLFDPKPRVLASGDLVTLPAPLFDTACPERWRTALGDLDRVDFRMLVPGHGAPMHRAEFKTYRNAFDHLLACGASKEAKQACIEGWMRDARKLIPAADEALARSLLDYYIDGSLRADAEKTRKLCTA